MVWEKIADKDGDGTGGFVTDSYGVKIFTMFLLYVINTTSNVQRIKPNSNSDEDYSWRGSNDVAADVTAVSQTVGMEITPTSTTPTFSVNYFMDGKSGLFNPKILVGFAVEQNTAGAGNIPSRRVSLGKTIATSRVSSLEIDPSAGNDTTGSNISELGTN